MHFNTLFPQYFLYFNTIQSFSFKLSALVTDLVGSIILISGREPFLCFVYPRLKPTLGEMFCEVLLRRQKMAKTRERQQKGIEIVTKSRVECLLLLCLSSIHRRVSLNSDLSTVLFMFSGSVTISPLYFKSCNLYSTCSGLMKLCFGCFLVNTNWV